MNLKIQLQKKNLYKKWGICINTQLRCSFENFTVYYDIFSKKKLQKHFVIYFVKKINILYLYFEEKL